MDQTFRPSADTWLRVVPVGLVWLMLMFGQGFTGSVARAPWSQRLDGGPATP